MTSLTNLSVKPRLMERILPECLSRILMIPYLSIFISIGVLNLAVEKSPSSFPEYCNPANSCNSLLRSYLY